MFMFEELGIDKVTLTEMIKTLRMLRDLKSIGNITMMAILTISGTSSNL